MARLQERFPHAVALLFEPEGTRTSTPRVRLEGRSDHAIAVDFVAAVRGTPASAAETSLLQEACDACVHDPDADAAVVR